MDFYTYLSRYYDELFPANPKQTAFLKALVPKTGLVLDVGAGTGGYSAALAEAGAVVEALEIGSMAPRLMAASKTHGFTAYEMGMEGVGSLEAGAYGLIYCIGNTVVHLADRSAVTAFFAACRHLLKPEGQLVIQTVNYDGVMDAGKTELPVITVPEKHLTLKRRYRLEADTVQFVAELSCEGEIHESQTRLLALRQNEMEQCLTAAGFKSIEFYGDFEQHPWRPGSPATIAVAQR